jgi:hypothetical protein
MRSQESVVEKSEGQPFVEFPFEQRGRGYQATLGL